jgi:hypothetical protein
VALVGFPLFLAFGTCALVGAAGRYLRRTVAEARERARRMSQGWAEEEGEEGSNAEETAFVGHRQKGEPSRFYL